MRTDTETEAIIDSARDAYAAIESGDGSREAGNTAASAVCNLWQGTVTSDHQLARVEEKVKECSRSAIDIVCGAAAFELMWSPNNPHHEFYKNLVKAVTWKRNHPADMLDTLVFLAPRRAIESLEGSDLMSGAEAIAHSFKIALRFEPLD